MISGKAKIVGIVRVCVASVILVILVGVTVGRMARFVVILHVGKILLQLREEQLQAGVEGTVGGACEGE